MFGHYQKRLGTRLLKLKKINKGPSELTKPIIDKLQNYLGIALREVILASFLHIASSDDNGYHVQCNLSWCQKEKVKLNKTKQTYIHQGRGFQKM